MLEIIYFSIFICLTEGSDNLLQPRTYRMQNSVHKMNNVSLLYFELISIFFSTSLLNTGNVNIQMLKVIFNMYIILIKTF